MNREYKFICSYPFSYLEPLHQSVEYRRHGILYRKPHTIKPFITTHNHNYLEIAVIKEGEGIHHIKGNHINFKKYSFHIVPQNIFHSFTINSNSLKFHNLCILIKTLPLEITNLICTAPLPIEGNLTQEDYNLVQEYFNRLDDLQNSNAPFTKEKIYGYIMLILTTLLECGEGVITKNNFSYQYIEMALNYIKENHKSPINLKDISRELNLSPNYFSKIFPKYMGYTFNEYLNYYRVRIAEDLILKTDKSLAEISFEVGFGSLSAFSRAFNKHIGCSALEFKRKFKNN